jgi:hypothetical protein
MSLILYVFTVLVFIINVSVWFIMDSRNVVINHYYFSVVISLLISSLILNFPNFKKFEIKKNGIIKFLLIILCLASFTIITYGDFYTAPIWLDEYTHLMYSKENIVYWSATQQQPPGGYIFSSFLTKIFGESHLTIRLTAFVPMLSALILALSYINKVKTNLLGSVLITFLFGLDPDMRYLSLEGRSIAYAIFSMILFIIALDEYLKEKNINSWMQLTAYGFVFLASVGMQPLFLIALALVYLFFIKMIFKTNHDALLFSFIVSLLAFSPVQLMIQNIATLQSKFYFNIYERILNWYTNFNIIRYIDYITSDIFQHWFSFGLLISAVIIISTSKNKKHDLLTLGFLLLWIPVFDLVFHVLVRWNLQRWYYALYLLLFHLFLINRISMIKKYNLIKIPAIIIILIFAPITQTKENYKSKVSWRPNWEKNYRYAVKLNENVKRIYVLGRCEVTGMWCYDFLVGANIYDKEKRGYNSLDGNRKFHDVILQDNGLVHDAINLSEKISIAIVIYKDSGMEQTYEKIIETMNDGAYTSFQDPHLITIIANQPLTVSQHIEAMLPKLINISQKKIMSYYPYQLLIWYYIKKNNAEMAQFWYDEMMKIPDFSSQISSHPIGSKMLSRLEQMIRDIRVQP